MKRNAPLTRRTPLKADPAKTKAWQDRSRQNTKPTRRPVSAASLPQRRKVRHAPCIRCGALGPCHPAHLIDRSIGGTDDPRAVVPLCPACHRLYDEGGCSLLEHLEPYYRAELAYAVELVGLVSALNRITNERYEPRRAA